MQHKKRLAHTSLGRAWEIFERAKYAFELGKWRISIELFTRALGQFSVLVENEGAAMCNAAIAAAYNNDGCPKEAIPYAREALEFYSLINLKPQLAEQQQNLAMMYTAVEELEKAEELHLQAVENYCAFDQLEYAARNLHAVANLRGLMRDPHTARNYFVGALKILAELESSSARHTRATALMQLAYLEKFEEDNDSAQLLYSEALEIFEFLDSPWEAGTCLEGLAAVAFERGNPELAAEHMRRALEIFSRHGFEEDATRAAANYRATVVAASLVRRSSHGGLEGN